MKRRSFLSGLADLTHLASVLFRPSLLCSRQAGVQQREEIEHVRNLLEEMRDDSAKQVLAFRSQADLLADEARVSEESAEELRAQLRKNKTLLADAVRTIETLRAELQSDDSRRHDAFEDSEKLANQVDALEKRLQQSKTAMRGAQSRCSMHQEEARRAKEAKDRMAKELDAVHVDMESLPESWYCGMNQWDATHNDCRQAEEGTERGDVPVAAVQTSNENRGEALGGVEEEKMVDVLEQEVEDGEEWMQEDLLICIPRNYPPAVVDDSREGTLGGYRHSSPRPKRPTAGSSGSSSKKKSKFKEGVLPLVTVAMQQLPPAGEVMMESWVQCEDRDCRQWHQVSDSVLAAVKDKKVTCGLMALECTKKAKKEEKKDDPPAKWTACAFDTSYMQCVGCGRLSYRRDVLKGKACDVCGKL